MVARQMTAYYNEIEPYCAEWLRNLMHEGLIADGEVDTRSIVDVTPNDLAGFTQCHFFAGLGGWSGALRLAPWPDHRPVWTGSCPCQPFSLAGRQGGFADERHLWPAFRYLIAQRGPPVVFGEQVASATEWLGLVRGDLEEMGYAVGCLPIQAASAGADHLRDRYWFVADANDEGSQGRRILPECAGERLARPDGMADADSLRREIDQNPRGSSNGSGAKPIAGLSGACHGDVAHSNQPDSCEERQQRSGQFSGTGCDQESRDSGDLEYPKSLTKREPDHQGYAITDRGEARPVSGGSSDLLEWVVGADGKARRVKSGIRMLAHGVPARVAKLRALGNAIDLRPAAAFIKAVM